MVELGFDNWMKLWRPLQDQENGQLAENLAISTKEKEITITKVEDSLEQEKVQVVQDKMEDNDNAMVQLIEAEDGHLHEGGDGQHHQGGHEEGQAVLRDHQEDIVLSEPNDKNFYKPVYLAKESFGRYSGGLEEQDDMEDQEGQGSGQDEEPVAEQDTDGGGGAVHGGVGRGDGSGKIVFNKNNELYVPGRQARAPGVQVDPEEHHHDGGQVEGDGAQHTANNVQVMQEKYCPSRIDGVEQRGVLDEGQDGEGGNGAAVQGVQAVGHGRDCGAAVRATPQHGQGDSEEQVKRNGSRSSLRKKKSAKRRIVAIEAGLVQSRITDFVLKFPQLAQPNKKLNFKESIQVQSGCTKASISKKRKIGGIIIKIVTLTIPRGLKRS